MELLGKIRRMYVRDKMSVRATAKRTGLPRNTLQKWLQASEEVAVPKYIRAKTFGKLAAFTAELEQALKADASRNKQDRRTGKALFAQIKASGYAGGYTRVTDFIRAWRASAGKDVKAFVPLKFDLGEAFQFDWSVDLGFCQEGLVIGGIYRRMQVSRMLSVRQSRLLAGGLSQPGARDAGLTPTPSRLRLWAALPDGASMTT